MITMSVWNLFNYYKDVRGKSLENIEFQQRMIDTSLEHVEKLLKTQQQDAALILLDANYASNYFDFFILQKNGRPLSESSNVGSIDLTAIPETAHNYEIKTPENTFYFYRKVLPPYDVILGYFPADTSRLSMAEIRRIFSHNIQDTILLFLAITGFVLREYFRQVKLIQLGRREDFEKMSPLTKEGRMLRDLFLHATDLSRQRMELEVPDGVEVELSRGTKDRSVFRGAILRIDLNHYSQLCRDHGQARVDGWLSPVFSGFREVAQRYGFFEVADEGDERVFYLRSEDPQEAVRLGVSVLRGMFAMGRAHSGVLKESQGVEFKFKGGLSYEDLLFVKEDGKYKLKGNAHIISKRCIGAFKTRQEKEYVVALPRRDWAGSEFLATRTRAETQNLQGLGETEIVFISDFLLAPLTAGQFKYFRSNEEISAQLERLQDTWSEEAFVAFARTLREVKVLIKSPEHGPKLLELLKKMENQGGAKETVGALLTLLPKLIPATDLNEKLVPLLRGFMASPHPRLRANALEALGELKNAVDEAREMLAAEDTRTQANAVLILGKHEMNAEVEKLLRKFLRSENENEVLSGLFVVDKLFSHHARRDLTFFRTSPYFRELFEEVTRLCHRSPERVRQRAQVVSETHGGILLPNAS